MGSSVQCFDDHTAVHDGGVAVAVAVAGGDMAVLLFLLLLNFGMLLMFLVVSMFRSMTIRATYSIMCCSHCTRQPLW